jgi:hypothetical protein
MMLVWSRVATAEPFVDAVHAGFGNHSVAMPFGHLGRFAPFYPAAEIGAEHVWIHRGVFDLAQSAGVGGWHHEVMGTAATLGTDLAARVTTGPGVLAEGSLGLGLSHTWRARPIVAWDEDRATYVPASDPGLTAMMGTFGVAVGYDFGRVTDVPLAVALDYEWIAQTPYMPGIAVGPQGILSLTFRWSLGGAA